MFSVAFVFVYAALSVFSFFFALQAKEEGKNAETVFWFVLCCICVIFLIMNMVSVAMMWKLSQ